MAQELAGYLEVAGAELYTVLHIVKNPLARILLVGPFASERHSSYFTWVRWARYLASRNIEVLHFDYRGTGESTGKFEQLTFHTLFQDTLQIADRFRNSPPALPFFLHGLRMGTVLAGIAFDQGVGDALLLWSSFTSANHALRSILSRWFAMKQMSTPANERVPMTYYLRHLEENHSVRVEGYNWSGELWRSSLDFVLPPSLAQIEGAEAADPRPFRNVEVWKEITILQNSGSPRQKEFGALDVLFADNFHWMTSCALLKD